MTTVEALQALKALVEDCGSEQPQSDMNEVVVDLATKCEEYSDALAKAIRTLS